jgi:hypothetical protein
MYWNLDKSIYQIKTEKQVLDSIVSCRKCNENIQQFDCFRSDSCFQYDGMGSVLASKSVIQRSSLKYSFVKSTKKRQYLAITTEHDKIRNLFAHLSDNHEITIKRVENEDRLKREERSHSKVKAKNVLAAKILDYELSCQSLAERKSYYGSLSEKQLDKLWNDRAELNIGADEVVLIRQIIRKIKGINLVSGESISACCQCGMVGENCTCKRSWF